MSTTENGNTLKRERGMEDYMTSGTAFMYNQDGPPEAKRATTDVYSDSGLTTEEYPVPDSMVGLIIGRGGDQITKIQADSGCRVAVVPQSTGGEERPCTLTGTTEQIDAAKLMLGEIIARGSVKETSEFNGHPAPSANELMNQNVCATANMDGNTMEEIIIPHDKCGIVIGKNGNTLRNLRAQFGCSVNLDSTVNTGDPKPLRIAGPPDKVNLVVAEVHKMMAAKENITHTKVPDGQDQVTFMIPKVSVGVVIGKAGETINRIQEQTQTRIQFVPDDPKISERGCYIIGPKDGCLAAQKEVLEVVRKKMEEVGDSKSPMPKLFFDGKRYVKQDGMATSNNSGMGEQQVDYPVPASRAGVVIGKGGETINSIKEKTGAFVQINKSPPAEHPDWKYFTIRGNSQQIAHAQKLIQEKVGGPAPPGAAIANNSSGSGYSYTSGQYGGAQGGSQDYSAAWAQYYAQIGQQQQQTQQQAPASATGQPDYSKAWEEYFKKTGQTPQSYQASLAQQQAAAAPAPAPAAAGAAPAPGGQDYSAQWADYYRKLAEYQKAQKN